MEVDNPLFVETSRGFSVFYKERWLYSRHDPARAALAAIQSARILPETLYLVFSPCLCYGLETLLKQLPKSSALLAVETDEHLMRVALDHSRTLREHYHRFYLIRTTQPAKLLNHVSGLGNFKRIQQLKVSAGQDLDPDTYTRLYDSLAGWLATNSRNRLTAMRMGRLWLKNLIWNLATMDWNEITLPPVDTRPVLVAGAGPSLHAVLPLLRQNRQNFYLMACDTALGSLKQAGIAVDAVVCLEGQIHNIHDFLPLETQPLVSWIDLSAHPATFRALKGPKIIISSNWNNNRFLIRLRQKALPVFEVAPLGSVGVLALQLARQFFTADILLTGLDFGFIPGQTHCVGSPIHFYEEQHENRLYRQAYTWRSSFRSDTSRLSQQLLTTPVMEMYAGLARQIINEIRSDTPTRQIIDLRLGLGLKLGLDSREDSLASLRQEPVRLKANQSTTKPELTRQQLPAITLHQTVLTFLTEELTLLMTLRAVLAGKAESETLIDLLEDTDYLYSHFPDAERVMELQLDALKRVALEAAYWTTRLETAIETMKSTQTDS